MPTLTKRRSTLADYEVATVATPPVDDRIVHQVLVAEIQPSPRNPRHRLEGIDELAASIAEHQLLQPVVVRRRGRSGYELIAGHRRLEAVKKLGWTEIPAVVRDETSAKAYILTLVENLQREDLTPREEAEALEVLMREHRWTTRQVGEAIKRSHVYVSKRLRVFEDAVLAGPVLANQLPVSTAEELLRAQPGQRAGLVQRAIVEGWGQAQARRAILESNFPTAPERNASRGDEAFKRRLKKLRTEVVSVDPVGLSTSARAEARKLFDALRPLVAPRYSRTA